MGEETNDEQEERERAEDEFAQSCYEARLAEYHKKPFSFANREWKTMDDKRKSEREKKGPPQ